MVLIWWGSLSLILISNLMSLTITEAEKSFDENKEHTGSPKLQPIESL